MPDLPQEINPPREEAPESVQAVPETPEKKLPESAETQPPQEQPEKPRAETNQAETKRPFLRRLPKTKPVVIPKVRDQMTVRIEKIMSEGLGDTYNRLSPIAKQEFKIKGEETADKIRDLLQATHVKVKKIFQLILEWLKMLPGINHFFLEQEAKIKTDRVIALKNRENIF